MSHADDHIDNHYLRPYPTARIGHWNAEPTIQEQAAILRGYRQPAASRNLVERVADAPLGYGPDPSIGGLVVNADPSGQAGINCLFALLLGAALLGLLALAAGAVVLWVTG